MVCRRVDQPPSWIVYIRTFVFTVRHAVYPTIDPAQVRLPNPITVCITDRSRGIGAPIAYANQA